MVCRGQNYGRYAREQDYGMQEGEFLDKDPHLSQSKRLAHNTLQK